METKTVTITIADKTQPARNLEDLIANGSGGGYTVVPAAGYGLTNITRQISGRVSYCSVQSSPSNSQGVVIYTGDDQTQNDGSRQGKELTNGVIDVRQAYPESVFLDGIYVRTNTNEAKINVEIHYS